MTPNTNDTDIVLETFSALGSPARFVGRLPLISRHIWNGFSSPWPKTRYAKTRFGVRYKWRPWLLLDVEKLELVEKLLNEGSDEKVSAFRQSQLMAFQMVAIIVRLPVRAVMFCLSGLLTSILRREL